MIIDYAYGCGLDPLPVLSQFGVSMETFADHEARIDATVDAKIWDRFTLELGDPDLGVHLNERAVSTGSFGLAGYIARTSATLAEALAHSQRYQPLIKENSQFEVKWGERGATVVERLGRDIGPRPRSFAEASLCSYVTLARAWTGEPMTPVEVRFSYARPRDAGELERFFGCSLRFDQPATAVEFSRETLETPMLTADPEMLHYLQRWAALRLQALGDRDVITDVRAAVHAELVGGTLSIQRVARRLAVSTRTLQRQLGAGNTSFRDVVDAIRHQRAIELLRAGVGLDHIAEQLGFSDTRAFRRAFRRWTGQPPSQWSTHTVAA
jgi:AraC-like DNA-binding protein